MIWFGNLRDTLRLPPGAPTPPLDEELRMRHALVRVAEQAPHLAGAALVAALAATGWVDHATAARLLPAYRDFDADRTFAEALRGMSFRGDAFASEFRMRIQRVMADLTGDAWLDEMGSEECIRAIHRGREVAVLAYPRVSFTLGGASIEAVCAAAREVPDVLVIVARNFQEQTHAHLSALLAGSDVPGTLVTVNLLLGLRAAALHYQPDPERVLDLLALGRPLRTQDVARLGERQAA